MANIKTGGLVGILQIPRRVSFLQSEFAFHAKRRRLPFHLCLVQVRAFLLAPLFVVSSLVLWFPRSRHLTWKGFVYVFSLSYVSSF